MNKKKITEQILSLISTAEDALQARTEPYIIENGGVVTQNLSRVKTAFCGSWLGYHANVYYAGFDSPAPRDGFSPEWGLMNIQGRMVGSHWVEATDGQVRAEVMNGVDSDYEKQLGRIASVARASFDDAHNSLVSLLAVLIEFKSTQMLEELNSKVSGIQGYADTQEIIRSQRPSVAAFSRDSMAVTQGLRTPPHVSLEAWQRSEWSSFAGLLILVKEANKLLKYMEMSDLIEYSPASTGSTVFIGHGGSPLWRDLNDFIGGRLSLSVSEFNSEPTAGITTKERLQTMLDQACFAFLLMTGEDQHADESIHARENVIHEVGLFQGRLGFRRAVVLLEDGCNEFSNIQGLSQIRFPKGDISAKFEDVRRVLEREGIVKL